VKNKRLVTEKVLRWIQGQLQIGEVSFEVMECTQAVGLDPTKKEDIDRVDQVFQWYTQLMNEPIDTINT
jgi:hypothetical protein